MFSFYNMKKALLMSVSIDGDGGHHGHHEVSKIYKMLTEHYGYRSQDILVCLDSLGPIESLSTFLNITKKLSEMAQQSRSCDEIWIYYSGHGTHLGLQTCDKKIVTNQMLYDYVHQIKCPCMILLDCCHSGTIGSHLEWNWGVGQKTYQNHWWISNPNVHVVCSCSPGQLSAHVYDSSENIHIGVFTVALLKILELASYRIDLLELYENVCDLMKKMNLGVEQTPLLGCTGGELTWKFVPRDKPQNGQRCIRSNFIGLIR